MELKGPDTSKIQIDLYTKANMESYKIRLSHALKENGINTEFFCDPSHSDLRQYIINYVQQVFIENKTKNDLERVSYKLTTTTITNELTSITYPVVNKFQGHFLIETYYFKLNPDNTVSIEAIPFINNVIII